LIYAGPLPPNTCRETFVPLYKLGPMAPDGLRVFLSEARPGFCFWCDAPLAPSPTKKAIMCKDPECKRAYFRLWKNDRHFGRA
jgi:hypothetical protein